jgi:hypothetical protein
MTFLHSDLLQKQASAIAATEKQSRVIVVSSFFIRNPDSQIQNTWLLFVELGQAVQGYCC